MGLNENEAGAMEVKCNRIKYVNDVNAIEMEYCEDILKKHLAGIHWGTKQIVKKERLLGKERVPGIIKAVGKSKQIMCFLGMECCDCPRRWMRDACVFICQSVKCKVKGGK